ncbi:CaiB/BaiF CoA-transferase family protein [Reyranella sp. CPCC 100927]|uniref:CaiB/BaiF CoA transferase family protein n=1 Tax=Reyranella sp. CPCC 100927 TaxID=2599616 RepID=UPI0011B534C6|nr:CoA transferase [Reyranella sp. CPCC 100927]TWT08756.1 CoA transferase [Reyranella sp. CPCC 100927]
MQPLKGVRVMEFTLNIAGSQAGQILAALGAEVIKIERPDGGDDCRAWGPPFARGASMMFNTMNRGKKSIRLDLKNAEAVAWVRQQLAKHDVLIENMRPGAMEAAGLGAAALRAEHPHLVYCSLSAFGSRGPLQGSPGYEEVVQAFSGLFSVNGDEASPPARIGTSVLDLGTGIWAALGCLSALMERHRTGQGCLVEGSLLETALGWLALPLATYAASGELPRRSRSGSAKVVVYRCFDAQDGEIMIAGANDRLFAKLARALGHPEWAGDERFRTARGRSANREMLNGMIEPLVRSATRAQWMARLAAAGVPCAPVNTLPDVLDHPQVQALDIFDRVEGSDARLVRLPVSFDGLRPRAARPAPMLGEHDPDRPVAGAAARTATE